ncbi:MAG: LysM peptidoglycan-binding domain-containing protein [Clostridia bacterium]|nr:LysM peptidoglycan-binding domain-containing protein [Clostridia bacterium]
MVLAAARRPQPRRACPDGIVYAVRRGETLLRLARRFGVRRSALRAANPGVDWERLREGDLLCIPGVAREICPNGRLYTVRRGDTLRAVAARFEVPVEELAEANEHLPDPDLIYPGEQICVPRRRRRRRCPDGILYAVRRGETFFSLARRFGITVRDIEAANPGVDPETLQEGQVVCIPGVADDVCPDGMLYTVRRGETLAAIARRFDLDVEDLIEANDHIPDPDLIYPGEQVCVPDAGDEAEADDG